MSNYRRARVPGGTYFFTVNLLERRRTLLVDRHALLMEAFRAARARFPFRMHAWVVLPDHLHCLWTLPPEDADNGVRWRCIKTLFCRGVARGERLSARRRRKGERGIWQRRYWEHLVRNAEDLRRHFDYIHFNPVKHGYAARAADWPCSSFRAWVARGVYPVGWAGWREGEVMGRRVGESGLM